MGMLEWFRLQHRKNEFKRISLEDSLIFVLERAMAGFPSYFTKATTVTVYN